MCDKTFLEKCSTHISPRIKIPPLTKVWLLPKSSLVNQWFYWVYRGRNDLIAIVSPSLPTSMSDSSRKVENPEHIVQPSGTSSGWRVGLNLSRQLKVLSTFLPPSSPLCYMYTFLVSMHVEVRGQPVSLLSPCGSQRWNSGCEVWWQEPSAVEPSLTSLCFCSGSDYKAQASFRPVTFLFSPFKC